MRWYPALTGGFLLVNRVLYYITPTVKPATSKVLLELEHVPPEVEAEEHVVIPEVTVTTRRVVTLE